jgi:hypothetical protein
MGMAAGMRRGRGHSAYRRTQRGSRGRRMPRRGSVLRTMDAKSGSGSSEAQSFRTLRRRQEPISTRQGCVVTRSPTRLRRRLTDLPVTAIRRSDPFSGLKSTRSRERRRARRLRSGGRHTGNVAIDVSTTHLFEPGVRIHTRTPARVLQVMQIVSCLGMQRFLLGVPPLRRSTRASRSNGARPNG